MSTSNKPQDEKPELVIFAENIKTILHKYGHTEASLGFLLDENRGVVSSWKRARTAPSILKIHGLSMLTGIPIIDLHERVIPIEEFPDTLTGIPEDQMPVVRRSRPEHLLIDAPLRREIGLLWAKIDELENQLSKLKN